MRTRMTALALCLIMVSAFAVTGAVSAASKSNTRTYDVVWRDTGDVIGKLTVDVSTGHYVINANYGKYSQELKEETFKDATLNHPNKHYSVILIDDKSGVNIYDIGTLTRGGNVHGEGDLTDKRVEGLPAGMDILTWFIQNGDKAYFWPGFA